jgi:hypothetical protein
MNPTTAHRRWCLCHALGRLGARRLACTLPDLHQKEEIGGPALGMQCIRSLPSYRLSWLYLRSRNDGFPSVCHQRYVALPFPDEVSFLPPLQCLDLEDCLHLAARFRVSLPLQRSEP